MSEFHYCPDGDCCTFLDSPETDSAVPMKGETRVGVYLLAQALRCPNGVKRQQDRLPTFYCQAGPRLPK